MGGPPRRRDKEIDLPALPSDLEPAALADGELADDTVVERRFVDGGNVDDRAIRAITFDTVRLRRFETRRARLTYFRVQDARFDLCDLSSSDWEKASLARVELVGCKLLGLRADGATLWDVLVQDCQAPYAAFAGARCRAVKFARCNLSQASFTDADLSGVVFFDCDLGGADMMGAKLVGADLRGSKLEGARLGAGEVRGATFDPDQAALLLRGFGARVVGG